MKKKFLSRRGETLLEVLVAVVVVALSAALLATMIAAGAKIGSDAETAMKKYYEQYNTAEGNGAGAKDNITITYKDYPRNVQVTYYNTTDEGSLVSYRK